MKNNKNIHDYINQQPTQEEIFEHLVKTGHMTIEEVEIEKNIRYCMYFSNESIFEFLINPLKAYPQLDIHAFNEDDVEIDYDSQEKIKYINLDGKKENFCVSFRGHNTSIFISDEDRAAQKKSIWDINWTFNEEFMFLDDDVKTKTTYSDTAGNIVYEGTLKDKTHAEILKLIHDFAVVLMGATKIEQYISGFSKGGPEYPKHKYIIKITNSTKEKRKVIFDNITFLINEDE